MKKILAALLLVSVLLLSGCTQNQEVSKNNASISPVNEARLNLVEIAKHTQANDCWMAIQGNVYDVSGYTKHPGGEALLEGCGKDATTLFETRPMGSGTPHSEKARNYLQNYYIGALVP